MQHQECPEAQIQVTPGNERLKYFCWGKQAHLCMWESRALPLAGRMVGVHAVVASNPCTILLE